MSTFDEVLTDTVALDEGGLLSIWAPYNVDELLDVFRFEDFPGVHKALTDALADGIGHADVLDTIRGVLLFEHLGVAETLLTNQFGQLALADSLALADLAQGGEVVVLADGVGFSTTLAQQLILVLSDTLGLVDTLTGAAKYSWTFADTLQLATSLAQFTSADIVDVMALAEALDVRRVTLGTLESGVGLVETVTPGLLLRAELADDIELSDAEAIQALYTGTLLDGVELTAGYLAPDGSFTTWVLNTATAAVTEYQDYQFNSFARIGNRYVGASSTGLYWLDGDDDVGEDIVARMRGGFLQFGGTHLSRLKAAYIATRNDSEFVLKIETGDGLTYNYAVDTRSMRSTKVHMGKGQRARYFRYELISTGDDFDIETLEFVPIVVQRRV